MKKYIYLNKEELKGRKDGDYLSYKQLIDHYLDNGLIMNNNIMKATCEIGYWELYNGIDYIEEDDYNVEVYQTFIIDEMDAERLAKDTDEIIYYNEELDMYLLGVTHLGTSWNIVETDYIITTDWETYYNQKESEVA